MITKPRGSDARYLIRVASDGHASLVIHALHQIHQIHQIRQKQPAQKKVG